MSGDVQPKRRRDRKRKKEEQLEETTVAQQPQAPVTPTVLTNDDITIHVHIETSLGGGVCAKCVFFVLMIVISVVIGITITAHRGQTDIDIPASESRFASIFEGWIDKNLKTHDDDDLHTNSEHVSHEDEEDIVEYEASEEHGDDEDEEEETASDEEAEAEDSEPEVSEEEEDVSEQEEEEEEDDEEESVQEDEESQEDYGVDQADDESQENEDKSESQEDADAEAEETEEDIVAEESEPDEQENSNEQTVSDEENDEKEDVHSEEAEESEEEIYNKNDESPSQTEGIQDIEEDDQNDDDDDNYIPDVDNAEISTANMAAKFGVGVSLLIVAYVVLVKKWKSDKSSEKGDKVEEEQLPDLARRNTFVPPPTLEEVEQDIENIDEEYSEEGEEGEESEDERRSMPPGKRHYEELRTTYNRSLTPDSDSEYNRRPKYREPDDDEEEEDDDYDNKEQEDYDDEEEEEGDDQEERDEEYEDDEDEELMKKLEAKYGRLETKSSKYVDEEDEYGDDADEEEEEHFSTWKSVKSGTKGDAESDSDNDQHIGVTKRTRSGAQSAYAYENITNADDYVIRNELDQAQRHLVDNVQLALNLFTQILENHPNSPRALYGKAQALDLWAEEKQSNVILQTSIHAYVQVLNAYGAVPDSLFLLAGERCINRMRFIGNYARAIYIHKILIDRFPNDVKYRNELAVTYLTTNKIDEARIVLMDILERWPNDGFALVHYGFILKTVDNKLNDAIEYLRRGIETKETGVIDGRFYFHLGDALTRLGKKDEAMKVYEDGVANKVFLSKYQRSLYNVERLSARPWWNKKHTPYASLYKKLEQHFTEIRDEALAILNKKGYFKDESENLRDVGDWKQFELYARGVKNAENCRRSPVTCSIVESEPDVKGCKRGQVKFSVMHPGTHVWPHCGPTNCRLRIHLGLKVPEKTYIRVAEETRSWEEGKIFIFDDSFEHEVWHNGTKFRLVLIIDIWHPDLTKAEKHRLSAI